MAAVKQNRLFEYIREYLTVYLTEQRNSSPHTIKAYRTALEQLVDFTKRKNNCSLMHVEFSMLNRELILEFLDSLEDVYKCSISTRNHKLKCIRSFFNYAAMMDLSLVAYRQELSNIPWKKPQTPEVVEFMSEAAVKALLESPNTTTQRGLRDQFMMILLYDTGARVQELLDLKVCDLRLGSIPTARLIGKGNKVRSVPIMDKTVLHLKKYLSVFHNAETAYSDQPLFYVVRDGHKQKMSDDNVRKFLHVYGMRAKEICSDVPSNLHPHLFRHSRAMHLYQHGMDLTLVSQWLGHANLETTLIYAHADTEMKRKAIEKATSGKCDIPVTSGQRFSIDDEETLKRLYGLR